jgi:hypothetical protein
MFYFCFSCPFSLQVPNVRFNAARVLGILSGYLATGTCASLFVYLSALPLYLCFFRPDVITKSVVPVLKQLQADTDSLVQEYAANTIQSLKSRDLVA